MGEIKKDYNPPATSSHSPLGERAPELDKLMEINGEARGAVFQTDAKYVLEKKGEESLKKLEERVKNLGYTIDYRKAKATSWYPIGQRIVSLLLIQDIFNWPDSEIREMGKTAPKFSFIVKFLFKIFGSTRKLVKEIPRFWKEHYTIGEIKVIRFNEEGKELVIHLINFNVHPLFCKYLEGYIERILLFNEKGVVTKETKCALKGDSHHEYISRWK